MKINFEIYTQQLDKAYNILAQQIVILNSIKELVSSNNEFDDDIAKLNQHLEDYAPNQEWVANIKNYIIQNNNTTEIGGNVEIDGKVAINSNVNINGTLTVDSSTKIMGNCEHNGYLVCYGFVKNFYETYINKLYDVNANKYLCGYNSAKTTFDFGVPLRVVASGTSSTYNNVSLVEHYIHLKDSTYDVYLTIVCNEDRTLTLSDIIQHISNDITIYSNACGYSNTATVIGITYDTSTERFRLLTGSGNSYATMNLNNTTIVKQTRKKSF